MRYYLVLIVGVWLSLFNSVFAFYGTNQLILVPSAIMEEAGYVEYGIKSAFILNTDNKPGSQFHGYFRTSLSDRFEYGITVDHEFNAVHSIHGNMYSYTDPSGEFSQNLAFGAKNLNWVAIEDQTSNPVLDVFAVYSFSILGRGSNYHLAVSRDQANEDSVLYMAGADFGFKYGRTMMEFDGKAFNFGVKYIPSEGELFYITISPNSSGSSSTTSELISIGLSFSDNVISSIKEKFVERSVLDENIGNLRNRIDDIDARERALSDMVSVDFLKQLETTFLDEKIIEKELEDDSRSMITSSISHMQRGLELYYSENYSAALEEYLIVVSLMPNFPIGYVRLGSIYHKLGDDSKARFNWEKALSMNPSNQALRNYLKKLTAEEGTPEKKVPTAIIKNEAL